MGQILMISKRFDIHVQPQFNLLQKTIVMAEGVARQLNPTADMWELSKPLAAEWVASQTNPERLIAEARQQVMRLVALVPTILDRLEKTQEDHPPQAEKQPSTRNTALSGALFVAIIWIIVHNFS